MHSFLPGMGSKSKQGAVNYLAPTFPEMKAKEASPFQKIIQQIEQQGVIDWRNEVNMTAMTRAIQ